MKWTQRQIEAQDDAHPFGCENPHCGCRQSGGPNHQPTEIERIGIEQAELDHAEFRERMAIQAAA